MIRWREAFERQRSSKTFQQYFGTAVQAGDFRYIAYCQLFNNVTAGTVTGGATPTTAITAGAPIGPTLQTFPAGAVILGIEAAGVQAQTAAQVIAPTTNVGLRNLFALNFQYTNDEVITPGGPVLAEALMGSFGQLFPGREIVVAPSQGLLCTVQAFTIAPPFNVHVVYHSMVPRVAN